MVNQTNEQPQAQLPDALLEKRVLGIPLKNLQNVGWGAVLMTVFLFLESILDVITGVKDGIDHVRARRETSRPTAVPEEDEHPAPETTRPVVAVPPVRRRRYIWLLPVAFVIGYFVVTNWQRVAQILIAVAVISIVLLWYGLSYRPRQKAKAAIDFVMRRDGLQLPKDATIIIERARQVPGTATLTTDRAIPEIVMRRCMPKSRRRRLPFRIVINLGALPRLRRRRH